MINCSGTPSHLHLNQKALQVALAKLKNGPPTPNLQMRPRLAASIHQLLKTKIVKIQNITRTPEATSNITSKAASHQTSKSKDTEI